MDANLKTLLKEYEQKRNLAEVKASQKKQKENNYEKSHRKRISWQSKRCRTFDTCSDSDSHSTPDFKRFRYRFLYDIRTFYNRSSCVRILSDKVL